MADLIPLAKFIEQLRHELEAATSAGDGAKIRFLAKSVVLELEIAVEEKQDGSGDVSFKVFNVGFGAKAGGSLAETQTQKLTLTLEPVRADGTSPLIAAPVSGPLD